MESPTLPPAQEPQNNQPPTPLQQPVQPPLTSPTPQTPPQPAVVGPLPSEPKPRRFRALRAFLSVLLFVGGIILAATLINQFIFQSYYVDGTSMTPTLQNNDRLIIDKIERTGSLIRGQRYIPKRGQVVVLDSSLVDQYGHSEQLIKRVVGLPGEEVIINTDGVVTIKNSQQPNGFDVNKELGLTTLEPTYVDSPIDITIPDGQIFVMGDNRGPGGSFDSRAFGPIDTSKIQGRLLARIFPLNKTGFF